MNAKIRVNISWSDALSALETMIESTKPTKVEEKDIKRVESILHRLRIRAAVQAMAYNRESTD